MLLSSDLGYRMGTRGHPAPLGLFRIALSIPIGTTERISKKFQIRQLEPSGGGGDQAGPGAGSEVIPIHSQVA